MFTSRTIYLPRRRVQPVYQSLHDGSILKRYPDGSGCIYRLDGSRVLLAARITDYDPGGPLDWTEDEQPLTVADCLVAWRSSSAVVE